jgi:hypothetical protein
LIVSFWWLNLAEVCSGRLKKISPCITVSAVP